MRSKIKPLVQFNAAIYAYPNNVWAGYWRRYIIEMGLSDYELQNRRQWLMEAKRRANSDFHSFVSKTYIDQADDKLLHSLLEKHGVFAEKFFHRNIHERVARKFAQTNIDLKEFQQLLSQAWGYEVYIGKSKSDAIYRVIDHIYEQAMLRAISNPQIYNRLKMWFKKYKVPRTCVLCGKTFRVIDLPYWIYFGSNGCVICCFQCPIVEFPKKKELAELVPAFIESCGFIPTSSASPINFAFTSRLLPNQWKNVFLAYARMGGIDHVKKKFGSWFRALADTRALPDGVLATARGIRCLAKDGHVCHSLDEQRIDDWLSAHGLLHEREPCYPAHSTLSPAGRRRADWKVRDVFIEYFGLIGNTDYEKKIDEKILLAQHFDIELIAIYPYEIEHLDQRLGHLL